MFPKNTARDAWDSIDDWLAGSSVLVLMTGLFYKRVLKKFGVMVKGDRAKYIKWAQQKARRAGHSLKGAEELPGFLVHSLPVQPHRACLILCVTAVHVNCLSEKLSRDFISREGASHGASLPGMSLSCRLPEGKQIVNRQYMFIYAL